MSNMFGTNPLLISSKGIIIDPQLISQPISIRYQVRNEWQMAIDESTFLTSSDLNVTRRIVIDSYATIILDCTPAMAKGLSADTFNGGELAEALESLNRSDSDDEDSGRKKKKRGRKARDEEDDEDEDDAEEKAKAAKLAKDTATAESRMIGQYAIDILVDRAIISDEVEIPIQKSQPYKAIANKSERNTEALSNNLAKLRKAVTRRGEAIDKLRGGSAADDLDEGVSDLLPASDKATSAIDQAGLKNYEDKLRTDAQVAEQGIRDVITFFKEKVVDVYNAKAAVINEGPFDDHKLLIQDQEIQRNDIIAKLFAEELVSINPSAKPKKSDK